MLLAWLAMAQVATAAPLTPKEVGFHHGRHAFDGYYPDRAQRLGIAGDVQARCVIDENARLQACELLSITPTGEGFDDSAKRLLPDVVMDKVTKDGQPTAGKLVAFTIQYRSTGFRSVGTSHEPRYSVTFK